MEAVAHNPAFAKKVGIKQSVGKDFSTADKGKTFKQGGDMASKMNPGFMAMMKKKTGDKPAKKMASGGSASSRADGIAVKGKPKARWLRWAKAVCVNDALAWYGRYCPFQNARREEKSPSG
jgi:hypothetical protein